MYLEFRRNLYSRNAEFRMIAWAATATNVDKPGCVKGIPKKNECPKVPTVNI